MSIALTSIALENAPLLKAIQADSYESMAALARSVGRPPKNIGRDLGTLEANALIEFGTDGARVRLTPAALAALTELEKLEGGGDEIGLRVDLLDPDPDQPRKSFDPFEMNALSFSLDRHGQLQPILIRQPDPTTGRAMIVAGERRWRAARQLAEWTEEGVQLRQGWPADKPMRCVIWRGDDKERSLAAVVENLQRADVPHLDLARHFEGLVRTHGLTPAEIAEEIGKSKKWVLEHLKVLREADAEDIAKFERAEITWTDLRDSVKTPTLTDKMLLALVELADAVERFGNEYGRTKILHGYGLGALPDLQRMGMVEVLTPNGDGIGFASVTAAGRQMLEALSHYPDAANRMTPLNQVRVAVLGAGPMLALEKHDQYASRFLAFPSPLPPPSLEPEIGRREDLGEAVHALHAATPDDAQPPAQDEQITAEVGLELKRPLEPRERLALIEVAHKIAHDPMPRRLLGQNAALVGKYWINPVATHLSQTEKLLMWQHGPDHPGAVIFTARGLEWLRFEGLLDEDGQIIALDNELETAQGDVGGELHGRYLTGWLTPIEAATSPPPPPAAPASDPDEDEDDPAEIAATEALSRVTNRLADASAAHDRAEPSVLFAATWCDLLDQVERPGPFFVSDEPTDAGIVWAANGECFCVCDTNGDLPADLASAQSKLIAAALNLACAYRPVRLAPAAEQTEPQPEQEEA